MSGRSLIVRLILIAALASAIGWFLPHRELLNDALRELKSRRFGPWAPILFVLLYALGAVAFVPGAALTVAGGVLFGPVWGTLWNLMGATLGATLAFLIARYSASGWVAARSGERLGRLIRGVEQEGWRFVAFVRLVPLFPFNLMNYAFGLTRIRLGEYVLASFVCMAPGAIAYTYLGYAGREAASGPSGATSDILFALALLVTIAFMARLVSRLRGRFIDFSELKSRLERGERLTLIDVRTVEEFDGPLGHIAGAVSIPLQELSERLGDIVASKGGPTVLICRTDKRSAKAAEILEAAGFDDVAVLRGGMEAWSRGNH